MTGLQLHWQQWQQHAREQWSRRVELASWVGSCPDERSDSVDEWRRTHALCLHAWGRDSEHESSWAGIVWTGRPHAGFYAGRTACWRRGLSQPDVDSLVLSRRLRHV